MRIAALLAVLILTTAVLADDHHVEFDRYTDFSTIKTFALRQSRTDSARPELNNELLLSKISHAIRTELAKKGLEETTNNPDVAVDFRISSEEFREQRGGRADYIEGTLIVDLIKRDSSILVWRAVYRDQEGNNLKLAQKLPGDVKKSFSEYPPRQKTPIEPRPSTLTTTKLSPKAAAAKALEIAQNTRRNTAFIGPDTHPGLSISLSGLERAAQTLVEEDGAGPAATSKRADAFYKALNDAADYANSIADRNVETPQDKATSRELARQLRSLSGT
jgi:hypothetical protein